MLTAAPRPELLSSSEREEIRRLRKENYKPRRANEILKSASMEKTLGSSARM